MDNVQYLSKDEIEAKLSSKNRSEALEYSNKVLSGEVVVGTKPVDAGGDATVDVPANTPSATPDSDTVVPSAAPVATPVAAAAQPSDVDEGDDLTKKILESEQLIDALRRKRAEDSEQFTSKTQEVESRLAKYEESLAEHRAVIEKLQKELDSKHQAVAAPVAPVIEEDEDVVDAASEYSRNTRKIIESLKEEIRSIPKTVANDDKVALLTQKLDALEAERINERNEIKQRNELAQKQKTRQQLFDSLRKFQSVNERFKTKTDPEELADQYRLFRLEVAEMIGSNEPRDINRAVDSLVRGNSVHDEEFRSRAVKEGVKIPNEIDKFIMLSDINDTKNGLKYNRITGNFDPIRDDMGRQVVHKSLDEAYKVCNFYEKINEARKEAAMSYQKKMDVRDNSAVVLDNTVVSSDSEHGVMTVDKVRELTKMPYAMYKNNPALAKQVEEAYRSIGIEPPRVGKTF